MYVCVRGEPLRCSCEVIGLDILGTRHPKIFNHILERMGFSVDCNNVVVYGGVVNERCRPDQAGRQVSLTPAIYPTDALNILVETGGFRIIATTNHASDIVWTLEK